MGAGVGYTRGKSQVSPHSVGKAPDVDGDWQEYQILDFVHQRLGLKQRAHPCVQQNFTTCMGDSCRWDPLSSICNSTTLCEEKVRSHQRTVTGRVSRPTHLEKFKSHRFEAQMFDCTYDTY